MLVPSSRFRFFLVLGCGLCAVWFPLAAQQPGLPGGPALPPPALPLVPGNVVPGATPPERADVHFSFVKSDILDVLHYYEELSGKHVIYDSTVQGPVTIEVHNVTRTDALRIIETAVYLNGFSLIPDDNNIVKVIGLGKPTRPAGVPIYGDLGSIPDSEQIITYILRLRFLDAQETAGVLGQYIPPNQTIAFTALKSANALLITDTARNARRLVSLVTGLDLPASPVTEKFIPLKRAEATKAVEFLNGIFDTKSAGSSPGQPGAAASNPANIRRPIRRVGDDNPNADVIPALGTTAGGLAVLSGDSLIQGRITLTAIVRTNSVHVVTSPVNMPLVEHLLEEFDADTPFAQPVRYPLRFVTAGDMLPILVDALKEQGSEGGSTPGSTGASSPSPGRSSSNSNFFGSSNSGSSGNSLSSGGLSGSGSGSGSGNSNFGDEANAPEVDTRPTEATVGNNKIIADQRTNTIILLGGADARSKISEILTQLDVRTPQVIIRTVIGELALDNNHELGFQYLLRSNRASLLSQFNQGQIPGSTTATSTTGTTTDPTTGLMTTNPTTGSSTASALNTFSTLATGLGSSFTGVGGIVAVGKSLDIILSALESTSRFKTISRPMIVTSNNKRAFISSGTKVAIPTGSVGSLATSGSSTGVYTNVELEDVVLKLSVTPLINSQKEVTLDIAQEINSLTGASTTVNGSAIPTIATRQLQNYVSARNGETIVLGGLITQADNQGSSDIPYLSKIPVLGNLFKSKTRDVQRNELIILMHPEVVTTAGVMDDIREKEENRTYLGHDLEDQLLPTYPVRKALPVNKGEVMTKATTTTTAPYVPPDDKLHPAARKTSAAQRKRTTTTTTATTTVKPND